MFVDEITLTLTGGHGGAGHVSFFAKKGGPSGGNGGRGGSVYAVVDPQMHDLARYAGRHKITADPGVAGGANRQEGATADDLEVHFPVGTVLTDIATGQTRELIDPADRVLIARGGRGGWGNEAFKTSTYQTPKKSEPGEPGESKTMKIVMRLIADYGLIGLPNSGKSSLLNNLTRASVKTANYPFTTLEPNLGAYNHKIIADIPGLIEGASQGKGLGIRFLKHIEKVPVLIYCISVESPDILAEYNTVRGELMAYNPALEQKKSMILLTKIDLVNQPTMEAQLQKLSTLGVPVHAISIYNEDSIDHLKTILSE